jgi:ParB family chromosome partitioning protein
MDGYFEVIYGSRRLLACQSLGWKKITCHVVELDDKQVFEVSLIENIQRKRLTPLDEADAFKTYVEVSSLRHQQGGEVHMRYKT